jgi:hypothetical protein
MSLKELLYKELQKKGYLSIDQFNYICDQAHKKRSNGERRMRELHLETERNSKGAIVGYRLQKVENTLFPLSELVEKPKVWED